MIKNSDGESPAKRGQAICKYGLTVRQGFSILKENEKQIARHHEMIVPGAE